MTESWLVTERLACVASDPHGLSVTLAPGARWGLLGAPGSGKTLWLRTLTHLQKPAGGHLYWRGLDVTQRARWRLGALRHFVALITANPAAVAEPWAPVRRLLPGARDEARLALERVGLPAAVLERRVEDLSLAQRARLLVGRALALGAQVLMLDNLAARLWPEAWPEFLADVDRALGPQGILWVASHRVEYVQSLAYGAVVAEGYIVEWGRMDLLRAHPLHPVTQALLAGRQPEALPGLPGAWEPETAEHWWRPFAKT